MEAMTMRKMMMIAAMTFAACGSVETPNDVDDGSGSDGSGSSADSDAGVPDSPQLGCMTAADCGAGQACDLDVHECVTGMLSIDSSDFIVEGNVWWTGSSDPTLRGTFQGPNGTAIKAKVGSAATIATLNGNHWTVVLPSGSIATSNVTVTIEMTDPSGGLVELAQTFGLDSAPPAIAFGPSKIRDERGDTIDFASGEPVHTHAGAEIDLSIGGCPSIYKYAYLMDATSPLYGSATSPNPLAWRVKITDAKLDAASPAFRVRSDAGQTLINWTALPAPDASGFSTVELHRSGGAYSSAAFGTYEGRLYVDIRAKDWRGQEATTSACWDHRPLAAPLAISSIEKAELFDFTLAADSPISKLLTYNSSTHVIRQRIVQHTAEPITIAWSATAGEFRYTKLGVHDIFPEHVQETVMCPSNSTDPICRTTYTPPADPSDTATAGVVGTPRLWAVLVDDATGHPIRTSTSMAVTWNIPARAAGEAPLAYRVEVVVGGMLELAPPGLAMWGGDIFGEYELAGCMSTGCEPRNRYTGVAAEQVGVKCVNMQQTAWGPACFQYTRYWRFTALDALRLDLAGFTATLATSHSAGVPPVAVTYARSTALATGALAWDAGDDNLPGASH